MGGRVVLPMERPWNIAQPYGSGVYRQWRGADEEVGAPPGTTRGEAGIQSLSGWYGGVQSSHRVHRSSSGKGGGAAYWSKKGRRRGIRRRGKEGKRGSWK